MDEDQLCRLMGVTDQRGRVFCRRCEAQQFVIADHTKIATGGGSRHDIDGWL